MKASTALEKTAILFIQQCDTAAFEKFTQGDASFDEYRWMTAQIQTLQHLTAELLDALDRKP